MVIKGFADYINTNRVKVKTEGGKPTEPGNSPKLISVVGCNWPSCRVYFKGSLEALAFPEKPTFNCGDWTKHWVIKKLYHFLCANTFLSRVRP